MVGKRSFPFDNLRLRLFSELLLLVLGRVTEGHPLEKCLNYINMIIWCSMYHILCTAYLPYKWTKCTKCRQIYIEHPACVQPFPWFSLEPLWSTPKLKHESKKRKSTWGSKTPTPRVLEPEGREKCRIFTLFSHQPGWKVGIPKQTTLFPKKKSSGFLTRRFTQKKRSWVEWRASPAVKVSGIAASVKISKLVRIGPKLLWQ